METSDNGSPAFSPDAPTQHSRGTEDWNEIRRKQLPLLHVTLCSKTGLVLQLQQNGSYLLATLQVGL